MWKKTKAMGVPTIDLSIMERSKVSEAVVKACEEYGIFKVVNHGVAKDVICRLEEEGVQFFAKETWQKLQSAGPANPFGYGFRNIGSNGDVGQLEYLLFHSNPISISNHPTNFSGDGGGVNDYIEGAKEVACEILELVAEGLGVLDKFALSKLIRDDHSDSVLRINHYPPTSINMKNNWDPSSSSSSSTSTKLLINNNNNNNNDDDSSIGFGEHSDPQILTIMRSNDVSGLQIFTHQGLWITVPPDPNNFFVMVGDALQVLTNGRFTSVRHRAVTNKLKARMSMMYFGAPPLNWWITPLPEMVSRRNPCMYKPFTWGQYKQAAYSLRLGDSRLDLFKTHHA